MPHLDKLLDSSQISQRNSLYPIYRFYVDVCLLLAAYSGPHADSQKPDAKDRQICAGAVS